MVLALPGGAEGVIQHETFHPLLILPHEADDTFLQPINLPIPALHPHRQPLILLGHQPNLLRQTFHDILLLDQFPVDLFGHRREGSLEIGLHDLELLLDPFDVVGGHALFLLLGDVAVQVGERGLVLFCLLGEQVQGGG